MRKKINSEDEGKTRRTSSPEFYCRKPHLKGYPIETVIAEKFEAMVKLGSANS